MRLAGHSVLLTWRWGEGGGVRFVQAQVQQVTTRNEIVTESLLILYDNSGKNSCAQNIMIHCSVSMWCHMIKRRPLDLTNNKYEGIFSDKKTE